jgi:hypothetical protein
LGQDRQLDRQTDRNDEASITLHNSETAIKTGKTHRLRKHSQKNSGAGNAGRELKVEKLRNG